MKYAPTSLPYIAVAPLLFAKTIFLKRWLLGHTGIPQLSAKTNAPAAYTLIFCFNGAYKPLLSAWFRNLFTGKADPFIQLMVVHTAGGYYCCTPLLRVKAAIQSFLTDRNKQKKIFITH